MSTTRNPLLPALLVLMSACASAGGPGAAEAIGPTAETTRPSAGAAVSSSEPNAAPARGPTSSSTFSEAQADRGRDTFRARCTECHSSGEFADARFQYRWSRRSAGSLYRFIQTSMPETAPGSLAPEEAVAVVAYILRMNGFESGAGELVPERAILDGISLSGIRGG
jgi:S-disulfanyl-L-cysteine oxidoreductase SoxD